MTGNTYECPWVNDDLRGFRKLVRSFVDKELAPHQTRWRAQHRPDAEAWTAAGANGFLLPDLSKEYAGGGGTFGHAAVVVEELAQAGVHFGSHLQGIVAQYIFRYGNEQQRKQWLPRMARGESIAALAITEPQAGSDLQGINTQARREGNYYVVDGSKAFVTNGSQANLICLAVKTDPKAPAFRGISILIAEPTGLLGYRVGRTLETIGMHGQDTCDLFFDQMHVPVSSLLGGVEGKGFGQLMEQLSRERLIVAIKAVSSAERALSLTGKYVKERMAFNKPLIEFQNTRFKLAECNTEAQIGRVFVDYCISKFIEETLDATTAAMAKYWLTECEFRIVDECVQLHGGYGCMTDCPVARMWLDSRVQRIYSGTTEIMKEVIASTL